MAQVKVRAVKLGFHKCRRYPGEEFMIEEEKVSGKSKWFEVVADGDVAAAPIVVDDEPDTYGAITKANAKKDKAAASKKTAE